MDATYRINVYDFNLITLMVLDNFQEGIPVMWALSNREDKPVLVTTLKAIKERCGAIEPEWYMTDMAQQYYNAWKEVFGADSTTYLWCAWHVDRAWRDGIKRYIHHYKGSTKGSIPPIAGVNDGEKQGNIHNTFN